MIWFVVHTLLELMGSQAGALEGRLWHVVAVVASVGVKGLTAGYKDYKMGSLEVPDDPNPIEAREEGAAVAKMLLVRA